jgi:hypothetical protein
LRVAAPLGRREDSDLFGVSGRAMLDALVAGVRDPRALADLARGQLRGQSQ